MEAPSTSGESPEETSPLMTAGCRRPYHYSVNGEEEAVQSADMESWANYMRFQYYSRLHSPSDVRLRIPDHVVPAAFWYQLPPGFLDTAEHRQSSIITIFAIWNTMMGTSILSMPWALEKAGFACGLCIMVVLAGICLYTAYRVIQVRTIIGMDSGDTDFSDVCRSLLGRWAEWASTIFSISSLLGAIIVYWVLMSNFLYNTGTFIHQMLQNQSHLPAPEDEHFPDVVCIPANVSGHNASGQSPSISTGFETFWTLDLTAPLLLIIPVSFLINFKSATCFTKCNAFGTLSVVFIAGFVITKGAQWGINADFKHSASAEFIPQFQSTFPVLTGTLTLAYFIHNCVTAIMKLQAKPENNARDLSIAYCLVAATYIFIGATFYVTFPLKKSCIADNLLNNFRSSDTLTFVARLFLLLQMMSVFPLLMYIVRIQFLYQVLDSRQPSWKMYIPLNYVLIAVAILFAVFYPHIGDLIRYTGSVCGLMYTFTLPSLTYMAAMRRQEQLTKPKLLVHGLLIAVGLANCIAQIFFH